MKVMDMAGAVDGLEAEVVGATAAGLENGGAAELGADDDEGFVEEAAGFEVLDDGGVRLVGISGVLAVGEDVAVGVPRIAAGFGTECLVWGDGDLVFDEGELGRTGQNADVLRPFVAFLLEFGLFPGLFGGSFGLRDGGVGGQVRAGRGLGDEYGEKRGVPDQPAKPPGGGGD